MTFDEIIEYLAKKIRATKGGYAINDAEVKEFLDQFPDYCDEISEKKKLDLDWIIREIKGEN